MIFSRKTYFVLAGLAAAASLAALAISMAERAVTDEARFRIRDFFEVGPNCEWISLKMEEGDTADEEAFAAKLSQADTYYFLPMIRAGRKVGITDTQAMTVFILEDMFPECAGQFPPESLLDVSKQLLYLATWTHVQSLMEEG